MKTFNLITLLLLTTSCASGKIVYVWNLKDLISFGIGGAILVLMVVVAIVDYFKKSK